MILARLLSATPNTDGEHWDLAFRWHQDAWHTDVYAQNPAPFQRGTSLGQRNGLPYPWQAGGTPWTISDAMFPALTSSFVLGLDLSTYPAALSASGSVPVNTPQNGIPPQVPLIGTTANTGGFILPGTYYIAISCNAISGPVPPFLVSTVVPPGTNTNTITVSGVVWPAGAATAPAAFAGTTSISMSYQGLPGSSLYTAGTPDVNGNPTVFTFTSINSGAHSTGLPDNLFQEYLMEATNIAIPGVLMDTVTNVSGSGTSTSPQIVTLASGGSWTTNQWSSPSRVLSLYSRPGSTVSGNVAIASNTAGTLTMADVGLGGSRRFAIGDVVVIRVASSSITANTIGDTILNLVASSQIGNQVRILSGTGANQPPKTIQSHTSGVGSVVTIQGTWDVTPDATSIWIITSPTDAYSAATNVIVNDGTVLVSGTVAQIALTWAPAQSLYVVVSTCDINGNCYPQRYQPAREIYVPAQNSAGSPGVTIGGDPVNY